VVLPRKFLNDDEELLAELRPHWIFLFGPLFTSLGVWVAIIALLIVWHSAPGWLNYPLLVLAAIPGLWLLGRFVRWRSYIIALTSTRILVRQGILGRDTVQLRLQRITEVNISQSLVERMLGTGRVIIDVQGEDDSLTLEFVRKPAVVQRVINSQINEIVGGGVREPIPAAMLPLDARRAARRDAHAADRDAEGHDGDDGYAGYAGRPGDTGHDHDHDHDHEHGSADTPPYGTPAVEPSGGEAAGDSRLAPTGSAPAVGGTGPAPAPGSPHFEIRDRLIELDDLRRRGILSEEEFAQKKSELLDRI
jgi:membrane protein YdbS with pleckstrin-like domain